MKILDSLVFSEYLIIAAFVLMFICFVTTVFSLIFNRASIQNNNLRANIFILFFETAFLVCLILVLLHEEFFTHFSLALICISVIFSIMLIWAYSQFKSYMVISTSILETLVGVLEAGDENLDGHSLHVQNLTMLIYDYLPFSARKSINPLNLQYASLLLDIGKLGIPRKIISKKGKLLPQERELIQSHPAICVDLFSHIPSFNTVTRWVKYHHERVDGTGYYHLFGSEIPLASRILALADTYSAITMERSYRPSLSHEEALSELKLVAGKQLDSELVELFCSLPSQKIANCMVDVKKRMKKYDSACFR